MAEFLIQLRFTLQLYQTFTNYVLVKAEMFIFEPL